MRVDRDENCILGLLIDLKVDVCRRSIPFLGTIEEEPKRGVRTEYTVQELSFADTKRNWYVCLCTSLIFSQLRPFIDSFISFSDYSYTIVHNKIYIRLLTFIETSVLYL